MTASHSPIAVLGLGLIGGSLARDLAVQGRRILGFDSRPGATRAALAEGIVHAELDGALDGVADARIIVIATPVDVSLTMLERLAPYLRPEAVVTDVGSVKRPIARQAERLGIDSQFAGSHPIAGDHRSGWDASRRHLFADAAVYVCPTASTGAATLDAVRELWLSVGAAPEIADPEEHDRRMAWVSHLPQILSSALAATLAESGENPDRLGPGGRDVTRLAGSSPDMWSSICEANADHIEPALRELLLQLQNFSSALERRDFSALLSLFTRGRSWLS